MHNFHSAVQPEATINFPANDQGTRLNRLVRWNADAERQARLFRHAREVEQTRLMRRPLPTREAFDLFGLLLGALVPAAIFYRLFNYGIEVNNSRPGLLLFPIILWAMNILCCLMGWKMGGVFGKCIDNYERVSWHRMCVRAAGVGALWGLTTGAVGGVLFFGVGSLFGALFALPVGIVGFALFTPLHRLAAHGGMIDARHFWPLACGVVLFITALVLSPHVLPY